MFRFTGILRQRVAHIAMQKKNYRQTPNLR